MIACTHPGKIGDALYALPAVRALCEKHGCAADFYTSEYCRPALGVLRAQPYVREAKVADGYQPERSDCGVQPWAMPTPDGYDAVYHLGFRSVPDRPLHEWIAAEVGVNGHRPEIWYDFAARPTLAGPYVVVSARGSSDFADLFRQVIDENPVTVVEIGGTGESVGRGRSLDLTGLDMLDTLPWIANASGFVGLSSAMLVLANGFGIPKVVVHDGKSWDQRHWLRSSLHHYPVQPSAGEVMDLLGLQGGRTASFSKTCAPSDRFAGSDVARQVHHQLAGISHRFEHPLRAWEYGLALDALQAHGCQSVLDVGGGGSVFAPAAASLGMEVVQVDPGDCSAWVAAQSERIGQPLAYHQVDAMALDDGRLYDAVTCLSVLEHVEDDRAFFAHLQRFLRPGGLLILTVDFWPDGMPQVDGHLRTYNIERLSRLVDAAPGFALLGPPDYADRGAHVYGYTFASLVLRKGAA